MALGLNANVTAACEAVGIARTTAYRHRDSDPAFAAAWEDALEMACDRLEHAAWNRAVNGTDKPVYQGGVEVGAIREYSDTLMVQLLKAHRPKKYRERMDLTGADGGPLQVESLTPEQRAARIAELVAKREGASDDGGTDAPDAA